MKKNRLIFFSLFIIFGCGSFLYWFSLQNHTKFIPTTFNDFGLPMVQVEVEGKSYRVVIDLGSKAQASFDQNILENINKNIYGKTQFRDFKDNRYESSNYLIQKIKLGDVLFNEVMVEERSEAFNKNTIISLPAENNFLKDQGSIGWTLLKRKNLLLDFPDSRLAIVDTIKQTNYVLEEMLEVPFTLTSLGVTITVGTDVGEKRFLLDTGSSTTAIRSFPCAKEMYRKDAHGLEYFLSSQFSIMGNDFGNMPLHLLNITPEMKEIDGLIGMNFLRHY